MKRSVDFGAAETKEENKSYSILTAAFSEALADTHSTYLHLDDVHNVEI